MFCPACKDTVLSMTERQGVEIDYCPKCRGVWLDRGELDKIIEKSAAANEVAAPTAQPQQQPQPSYKPDYEYKKDYEYKGYKRKKSFLEEIFD